MSLMSDLQSVETSTTKAVSFTCVDDGVFTLIPNSNPPSPVVTTPSGRAAAPSNVLGKVRWYHPDLPPDSQLYRSKELSCHGTWSRRKALKKLFKCSQKLSEEDPTQFTTIWSQLPHSEKISLNAPLDGLYGNGSCNTMAFTALDHLFRQALAQQSTAYGRSINHSETKSRWRLGDLHYSHILQNAITATKDPSYCGFIKIFKGHSIRKGFDKSNITGYCEGRFDKHSITLTLVSHHLNDETKNRRETEITFFDDKSAVVYFKNDDEKHQVIGRDGRNPGEKPPIPPTNEILTLRMLVGEV
ncbi:hypothetical protein I302_104600 [Kwoniella bestiolae CBS 10118]|uniref:Uncharacterized protein n=1 Tax=Kwoniella bestiolae CBS 10118 TaxID=1296100 RepID=A0A1B9GBR0_9TREE|nr:hypothetical protein I302_03306 [Kwoniella bestiolae CBS 10118]OCF28447.1 hypothetical protein I302_03306 [Kwoniella bestiolae CBS 10118]